MDDPTFVTRLELELRKEVLTTQAEELKKKLIGSAERGQEAKATEYLKALLELHRTINIISTIISLPSEKIIPVYLIGSRLLYESYDLLTRTKEESLHYLTGIRVENIFVITRIVPFELVQQSIVGVRGDSLSSFSVLRDMDTFGEALFACFHSHPGSGPSSTYPSSIDKEYQERLERGDYPTISAIFSRDGHVRFYSLNRRFIVAIKGRGVERVKGNLCRLTKVLDKNFFAKRSKS
jgi:proteasome lid subunit RPN8/RPN11